MSKKESFEVAHLTGRSYDKSLEQVAQMLIRFDPAIHDKINITILPTSELAEKQKKIDRLEAKIKDYDQRWKERYLVNNPFAELFHGAIDRSKELEKLLKELDLAAILLKDTHYGEYQRFNKLVKDLGEE